MKDKRHPIFDDDETHTSADLTSSYICVGADVWGIGQTPRQAISEAISRGLNRQKDHWAIWENLVPHGRFRLMGAGITVALPSDMSDEDRDFWLNPRRAQRLRMIACSTKFSSRIIRTRSDRLEERARHAQRKRSLDTDAALDAVEELLKGGNDGDSSA